MDVRTDARGDWQMFREGLSRLTVAFQPMVNISSGLIFGHEVLVRGYESLSYQSIGELFRASHDAGVLAEVEATVRRKAFRSLPPPAPDGTRTLSFNLDHRIAKDWNVLGGEAAEVPTRDGVRTVTEITAMPEGPEAAARIRLLKRGNAMVALDRFGATADGLAMLHDVEPDFIKIDRSFIQGIETDARKRVVLSQMIGMAHTLGVQVIAVGVENSQQLRICRDLGCDLVQGFFIQQPVRDARRIGVSFPQVAMQNGFTDRRKKDQEWVLERLDTVPAIRFDMPMREVFGRFASNSSASYLPVVDGTGRPLGILCESRLKNYAYSPFGKDLIANKQIGRTITDFVVKCPVIDLSTPFDQMLAIFSVTEHADGILITTDMAYRGFLSAHSLIRAVHEKNLDRAREENPLNRLAGNAAINEYIAGCLADGEGALLAYIDFNNFKPFNDTYGFRQGDRAILLFAELCRKAARPQTWFLGHIGGDDFFIGIRGASTEEGVAEVSDLIHRFASDIESFYDPEARGRGFITAEDREGKVRTFPLLSASAVLCLLPPGAGRLTIDEVSGAIAARKKEAKGSPTKLAIAALDIAALDIATIEETPEKVSA
jgi:EAL domain-containing protein (putative c-di-GMP-specific phosphodiesterase class I)/GGDEF domain-containing protein